MEVKPGPSGRPEPIAPLSLPPERPQRRRRQFAFLLLIVAQVFLILALWNYHTMLIELYDGTARTVLQQLFFPFSTPTEIRIPRIAILQSEFTAQHFSESRQQYLQLAERWNEFLGKYPWQVRLIGDDDISGELMRFDTLVLPATTVLTDGQIEGIKQFLRAGKGVIMTWACGTRTQGGEWRDYSLLSEVAGLRFVGAADELVPDGENALVREFIITEPSPITANIPPGLRFPVNLFDDPVVTQLAEPRSHPDAVWQLADEKNHEKTGVALAHGEYLGGRYVWISFTFGSPVGDPVTQEYYLALLQNAIGWVSRQPIASKILWPAHQPAALIVSHMATDQADSIAGFSTLLRERAMGGTLFIPSSLGQQYPDAVRDTLGIAEVAVMADTPSPLKGQPLGRQRDRLDVARDELAQLGIGNVVGLLPPSGAFDANTLDAMIETEYEYLVTSVRERDVPRMLRAQKGSFAISKERYVLGIPPPLWQSAATATMEAPPPLPTLAELEADYGEIIARQGVCHLMLPPELLIDANARASLSRLLDRAVADRLWIASAREIVRWWHDWELVKVKADLMAGLQLRFAVSNISNRTIPKIPVRLYLSDPIENPRIIPERIGTTAPPYTLEEGGRVWIVDIQNLRSGENRTFRIAPASSVRELFR